MNTELRSKLLSLFQYLSDIVSSRPENLPEILDATLADIIQLKKQFSEDEIVKETVRIAGNDALELYWLARAGFQTVDALLVARLDENEACQQMWAAMGLVYLGNQRGLDKLHELITLGFEEKSELTLEEIRDELNTSKNKCLINLINDIENRLGRNASDV